MIRPPSYSLAASVRADLRATIRAAADVVFGATDDALPTGLRAAAPEVAPLDDDALDDGSLPWESRGASLIYPPAPPRRPTAVTGLYPPAIGSPAWGPLLRTGASR